MISRSERDRDRSPGQALPQQEDAGGRLDSSSATANFADLSRLNLRLEEPGTASAPHASSTPPGRAQGRISRYFGRFGVMILVLLGVAGFKAWGQIRTSREVRQAAYQRYAALGDAKSVRSLVDKYHDECFAASYSAGGRRRSAKFDAKKYAELMDRRIESEITTRPELEAVMKGLLRDDRTAAPRRPAVQP